MNSLLDNH